MPHLMRGDDPFSYFVDRSYGTLIVKKIWLYEKISTQLGLTLCNVFVTFNSTGGAESSNALRRASTSLPTHKCIGLDVLVCSDYPRFTKLRLCRTCSQNGCLIRISLLEDLLQNAKSAVMSEQTAVFAIRSPGEL